jgi:hypothetical protein
MSTSKYPIYGSQAGSLVSEIGGSFTREVRSGQRHKGHAGKQPGCREQNHDSRIGTRGTDRFERHRRRTDQTRVLN